MVALVCGTANAKDLVRVAIPTEDFHDPLYVDSGSIRWNGGVVRFKYVLDVPILGDAAGPRRYKSNEIEVIMDCSRQTIAVQDLIAYSGVRATGDMIGGHSATQAERQPRRIDMRKGSTLGYLFRHLCKPAGGEPKKS
jgi:hypothetical protein